MKAYSITLPGRTAALLVTTVLIAALLTLPSLARSEECEVPGWFTEQACALRERLAFTAKAAESLSSRYRILFIYSKTSSAYDQAFTTIDDSFTRHRIDASYLVMNYRKKPAQIEQLLNSSDFDLAIIAGSSATSSLYRLNPNPAMPVVTVTAKDPVLLGLIDNYQAPAASGNGNSRQYAFTSLNVRPRSLVSYLKTLNPGLKAVGIVYGKNNLSALQTQVEPLAAAARKAGIKAEFLAIDGRATEASLEQQITNTLNSFSHQGAGPRNSLLWLTGSTLLFDQLPLIDQLAGTTPVLATVPDLVSSKPESPMLAIGTGFTSNARQAAFYGRRILLGQTTPGQLPVGELSPPDIAINFRKAHESDWEIPVAMFEQATILFNTQGERITQGGVTLDQAQ